MRILFFTIIGCILSTNVRAQELHQDVLKGLTGQELFERVIDDYKPSTTMPYDIARDTLYSKIDITSDGKLLCAYTGFAITLDPDKDPTVDAFAKGINAEHSYPQSKGASEEPARSNLHHLYPTRVDVNADRASYPYGESNDAQTTFWYLLDTKTSNKPSNNINAYSELGLSQGPIFEPREAMKGNIARGMMYFYTMYRQEAQSADPDFFPSQRDILCHWHFEDPVDKVEWDRTWGIAKYQEDKPNPFVLDCSLATRMYCNTISDACRQLTPVVDVHPIHRYLDFEEVVTNQHLTINNTSDKVVQFAIIGINGNMLLKEQIRPFASMDVRLPYAGIYLIRDITHNATFKMIKL